MIQRKQKDSNQTDTSSNNPPVYVVAENEKQKKGFSLRQLTCKRSIEILLILILLTLISFRVNFTPNQNNLSQPENAKKYEKKTVRKVKGQPAQIPATSRDEQEERDFKSIGEKHGTDKVAANSYLAGCLKNENSCTRKGCKRVECRPWGHFYNTFYQRQLGYLSKGAPTKEKEYQFLEIGYFQGKGFDTYTEFLPTAELHSMEISCRGFDWQWGNFAEKNENYEKLRKQDRLHCGDANDVTWINKIWTEKMNRTDAPPLMIVVDDGAHLAKHMAQTVFFWFPRIQPGGVLIVEDIQPESESNEFRTQFLPQIMSDLHYCGDPAFQDDGPCYPTLMPLLKSIYCEMHICMFERNGEPAIELDLESSTMPPSALDASKCPSLERK